MTGTSGTTFSAKANLVAADTQNKLHRRPMNYNIVAFNENGRTGRQGHASAYASKPCYPTNYN